MKYYQLNCPAHTPIKLLFDQSSGSSKYGTIRKNTQKYYKRKRLIRCIYLIFSPIMVVNYMFSELNCMLQLSHLPEQCDLHPRPDILDL